ncbi:C2H2 type zinc-finger-domain-containing protein [Clohesyomyces aquaticus]|uniref:C2H2 type zinc-finger-domain-containing protein n=1 Tax=Clohesyomyces aquaticus TaxID=1231657 RepID=A0A1Y1YFH6_9PLEO|nr:C2H2 type zinc-finger-domain-containing protein [Clohesyomyces aquaticus]
MDTSANDQAEPSPPPRPPTNYLCTSCQICFQNGQDQRIHMKEAWHVQNLKRRIASLPPLPRDELDTQAQEKHKVSEKSTCKNRIPVSEEEEGVDEDEAEEVDECDESEESTSPFQCLFCVQNFEDDNTGFAENLEHMRKAHKLCIPDPESVIDVQSLVGYLATEVRVWHECLYCGATKPSTSSIQSHMRDKGHCLLNLDREPELLDFWGTSSQAIQSNDTAKLEEKRMTELSATEMRFASGRVVESRQAASETKRASRKRDPAPGALPPGSEHAESSLLALGSHIAMIASGRQLARREDMGIVGISIHQRQALVLAEKKAQRSEAVASRAREWVYAKAANLQKYDQLDNQAFKGKQNHKLLPR